MKLNELLKNPSVQQFIVNTNNLVDFSVESLVFDYNEANPNSLYFCLDQEEFDELGLNESSLASYPKALEQGVQVLVANAGQIKKLAKNVGLIEVNNINQAIGFFARTFHQNPMSAIKLVGITGTNGKTSTAKFIQSILDEHGLPTGVIGTIGATYLNEHLDTKLTTPPPTDFFAIAEKMRTAKVQAIVCEITSHGLEYQRNAALNCDIAIWTNLSQDHLDFHHSMEAYRNTKLKLFEQLCKQKRKSHAVINMDDSTGIHFIQTVLNSRQSIDQVEIMTFGIRNKVADLIAYPKTMDGQESQFDVFLKGELLATINLQVPGLFSIYNALASIATALILKVPVPTIQIALQKTTSALGRLERIKNNQGLEVLIDYSHTPESLRQALMHLKQVTQGRVLLVFGCGGLRDRSKRPLMGQIAEQLADKFWITADNPRQEPLKNILKEIKAGISKPLGQDFWIVQDRQVAIFAALQVAQPGDSVLIAGKGHEQFQIIGTQKIPFSDQKVAREFFSRKVFVGVNQQRAWTEVDLNALHHNFALIQKDMPMGLLWMAVVKDQGLGVGTVQLAKAAESMQADYLAVANLEEGVQLRQAGLKTPILVLGERSPKELPTCLHYQLSLQVQSFEQAVRVDQLARHENSLVRLHLKVDSGMGRYGVVWTAAVELYQKIQGLKNINLEGIMTHFAQSDEADKTYANLQGQRFQKVLAAIKPPKYIHACNSGGFLDLPQFHFNTVRLGILPTGVYPSKVCRRVQVEKMVLKPVVSVKARLAAVKTLNPEDKVGYGMHFIASKVMRIGIVPMGYGDGFLRLRNQGHVLIRGQKAKIVGGVSLDAVIVALPNSAEVGDEVVFIGQQGREMISVNDWAQLGKTVSYAILANWPHRLPKVLIQ